MIASIVSSLFLDEAAVRADPQLATPQRMLRGEFETQDAILIGWQAKDPIIRQVLISIVSIAATNVPVLVLADDAFEQRDAAQALSLSGVAPKSIHILTVPCDTIWVRDFGPIAVTTSEGSPQIIDLEYAGKRRRNDDRVPQRVAQFLRMRAIPAGLSLEGGNLLSNGRGSLLSTSRILDQNFDRGLGYRDITQRLHRLYGCRTPILLEPLQGEPTGHIDMFAAFTDATTVVIGTFDPLRDPVNAKRLDRNAKRLSSAGLRVVRVPMPDHSDGIWRSYTNVLFANGKLLVPTYASVDLSGRKRALSTYRTLLPEWSIVPVDCTEVIQLGGALHCLSMNLTVLNKDVGRKHGPARSFRPTRSRRAPGRPSVR
jgi:agmatine deiminase